MKNPDRISVKFLGAAGTVTGSKYLVKAFGKTILIDCGLFQGIKKLRELNWAKFPVDPGTIDLVVLTHGHLDHVGYLPRLVKAGYENEIWGVGPTLQVAKIILEDSGKIQEEAANAANEKGFSKHHPALPLYDLEDVAKTVPFFTEKLLDQWHEISPEIKVRFRYNSHIIGATFIELQIGEKMLVFSGDIGRDDDLLLFPPQKPERADYVFIESTYGDRLHPKNAEENLAKLINKAAKRQGTIIIPSFAVERTQILMYLFRQLREKNAIPHLPIYMDSPMGANVLSVFAQNTDWHKLTSAQAVEMLKDIKILEKYQDSMKMVQDRNPKIVIAGSGMATGGRVLQYLKHYLSDNRATILMVGYQAEGTRGRQLLEGAPDIKIEGQYYLVKAHIEQINGLSAHADQHGLLNWLSELKEKPRKTFIVHGEPTAADAFRTKLETEKGYYVRIPELYEEVYL
ncbi:MBL fold metallo-hydrolase RNA specificity domain-containing protein [Adhaeribacter terreus]|uniref:MBL fold metallo-hydrolase RNA specificity domain-containing protein n=1 Tax=Adhaeribacter terreus TaxID=529703 RepID=A0ABW0EC81_9BACT